MSIKTDRLVDLFPDAYAARDPNSLLYQLLDAFGAELMAADGEVKRLLQSHWVDYAAGEGLDKLAASLGVTRRTLISEEREEDEAFRQRIKSFVDIYVGGGTKQAVLGAVRLALGLPFDPTRVKPPLSPEALDSLNNLIWLEEFPGKLITLRCDRPVEVTDSDGWTGEDRPVSQINITVDKDSEAERIIQPEIPVIRWTFKRGDTLHLYLTRTGGGEPICIRTCQGLQIRAGETLTLSAGEHGSLRAVLGFRDCSGNFVYEGGQVGAVMLPEIPVKGSDWYFGIGDASTRFDCAKFDEDVFDTPTRSGRFDNATFDYSTFDFPDFAVEMSWLRRKVLSFDVHLPYYARTEVENRIKPSPSPFLFRGAEPPAIVQEVVREIERTRAAGVDGRANFHIYLTDRQEQVEGLRAEIEHRAGESQAMAASLQMAGEQRPQERHEMQERLMFAGVWDNAFFDRGFVFME